MIDPIPSDHTLQLPHKKASLFYMRNIWIRVVIILLAGALLLSAFIDYLRAPIARQPATTSVVSIVNPPPPEPIAQPPQPEEPVSPSSSSLDKKPYIDKLDDEDTTIESPNRKISELEKNVATLTSTVTILQNELQSRNAKIEQTQQVNAMTLAVALAFLQLREQALSGHSFAHEYEVLLRVSQNMPDHFQEQLHELQQLSAKNTPNTATLHETLKQLEPQALKAIQKAEATTWIDRIIVELKGLVSIRRLNETTPNLFQSLERAFIEDDLSTVQTTIQNLPAAAQPVLEAWDNDFVARNQINKNLHNMMDALIEQNITLLPQQDRKP